MRIPLVLAADDAFALPLAVSIASVVRSADAGDDLELHVLESGISEPSQQAVDAAAHPVEVAWHRVDEAQFAELPTAHLSPAAYYRLLIPELLDSDRAIYLDSDVLVRKSLRPMVGIDLGGRAAAAARNLTVPFLASPRGLAGWSSLGLDPAAPYFNSGVIVIDLPRWRDQQVMRRAIEYAGRFEDGVRFADQDALNAVLYEDWAELPATWNQQPLIHDDWSGVFALLPPEQIVEARDDPAVVHFVGPDKPWFRGCNRPWADEWRDLTRELDPTWKPIREARRRNEVLSRFKRATHILVHG